MSQASRAYRWLCARYADVLRRAREMAFRAESQRESKLADQLPTFEAFERRVLLSAPSVTVDQIVTNDPTPTLTGSVDNALASIVVTVDALDYTDVAVDSGTGAWSVDVTQPLPGDGAYDVTAAATYAGETGYDSTTDELTLDTVGPSVSADELTTTDRTPALSGTVDEAAATVEVTVGGTTYAATNNGDGTWTLADDVITIELADGVYDVQVRATDAAGNVGQDGATGELIIDAQTAPVIAMTDLGHPDLSAFGGSVHTDLHRYRFSVEKGALATDQVNTLSISVTSTHGEVHQVWAKFDLGENVLYFDTPDPGMINSIVQQQLDSYLRTSSFTTTISAATEDSDLSNGPAEAELDTLLGDVQDTGFGSTFTFDGAVLSGNESDAYDVFQLVLPEVLVGQVTVEIEAAGPQSGASVQRFVFGGAQTTVPDLAVASDTGFSNSDNVTADDTPSFVGTAQAGSTIELFSDGVSLGTTIADAVTGAWSFTTTSLAEGVHAITATSTVGGVTSAATDPLTIRIDTSDPLLTIDTLVTDNATPQLSGTVDDASAVVRITIGDETYTAINQGDGSWVLPGDRITSALPEGSFMVTATGVDAAGNVGQASSLEGLTVDAGVDPAPRVLGMTINDGISANRSVIADLHIHFSEAADVADLVTVGVIDQAVRIYNRADLSTPLTWLDASRFTWDAQTNTLSIDTRKNSGANPNDTMFETGRYHVVIDADDFTDDVGQQLVDDDGLDDGQVVLDRSMNAGMQDLFRLGGDLNGDGLTRGVDLSLLGSNWQQTSDVGDMNGDGFVDALDLSVLAAHWEVDLNIPLTQVEAYTFAHDLALTVLGGASGLLANDYDPLNNSIAAVLIGDASNGSVVLNADGTFTYTPDAGFAGSDAFTYLARAADGRDSVVTTVSLVHDNRPPQASNDSYTVVEDQTLDVPFTAIGVLWNDDDLDGNTITVEPVVDDVEHGTLALNADGTFIYTPDSGFVGTDMFTYRVSDGLVESSLATVTIEVRASTDNTPPTAIDLEYTTAHDRDLDLTGYFAGLLGNNFDADGDVLTIASVTPPAAGEGTLSWNADGTFTYTPPEDTVGDFTFTYALSDGLVASNAATVTVHVVNSAPRAVNDLYLTGAGGTFSVAAEEGLLTTDFDPEGDPLAVHEALSGPATIATDNDGEVVVYDDGSFDYTPDEGFAGTDTFTYHAWDGFAASADEAVVTIVVVNDPPLVSPDLYFVRTNSSLTIAAAQGLLANDFDTDGSGLTVVDPQSISAAHGTLVVNADGSLTYMPDADFTGSDTFTYTATDGTQNSEAASVHIEVFSAPPTPTEDVYYIGLGGTLTVDAPEGVLANDFGFDDELALTAIDATVPGEGALAAFNGDGSFTYEAPSDFTGVVEFEYTLTDGVEDTGPVRVTIYITNGAPLAFDDLFTVSHDTPLVLVAEEGLLANDFDADEDAVLTVLDPTSLVALNGSLSVAADGSLTYTPNAGFVGTETFAYAITDGASTSAAAQVTIHVGNAAPVAVDDAYEVDEDNTLDASVSVLANDTDEDDVDASALTATLLADVLYGTLDLQADGTFTYTPDEHFHGLDSFLYEVTDTLGATSVGLATITVAPINDEPIVPSLQFDVQVDGSVRANLLADVTDADGDALMISLVDSPNTGAFELDDDGWFRYTADGTVSSDFFRVVISDGDPNANYAPISIDLTIVNDAPVANDATYHTLQNVPVDIGATSGVLANDEDERPDLLTVDSYTTPNDGTLTLNADGSFTYTPDSTFVGTDTFTYTMSDGHLTSISSATVSINVVNVDVIALDDDYSTHHANSDATGVVLDVDAAHGLLKNDRHGTGAAITAVLIGSGTTAQGGTVSVSSDGSFDYTSAVGFTGEDYFEYFATDGNSNSATKRATINVTNLAPVAADDVYTLRHDPIGGFPVDSTTGVLANDFDHDGDELVARLTGAGVVTNGDGSTTLDNAAAGGGVLTLFADGSFDYAPAAAWAGEETFTYEVTDKSDTGVSDEAEIRFVVTNAAPVGYGNTVRVHHAEAAPTFNVLDTDYDPDGDALSVSLGAGPAHGQSFAFDAETGEVDYTPDESFVGTDTFTYLLSDGVAVPVEVTVTFDVWNNLPVTNPDQFFFHHALTEKTGDVLGNDFDWDADGDSLTVELIDPATGQPVTGSRPTSMGGSVTLAADGTFIYTSPVGFTGVDTFVYRALDSAQAGAVTTVTLHVENHVPVAIDDTFRVTLGESFHGDVSTNDFDFDIENAEVDADGDGEPDPPVDALVYEIVSEPELHAGDFMLQPDGTFTYTPDPSHFNPETGYFRTDTMTYTVRDAAGVSQTATVTLHVGVDEVVHAADDALRTFVGTPLDITQDDLLSNDLKGTGAALVKITKVPDHGTLEVKDRIVEGELVEGGVVAAGDTLADGDVLEYTPLEDGGPEGEPYAGPDAFEYELHAGSQVSTARAAINIVTALIGAFDDRYSASVDEQVTRNVLDNDVISLDDPSVVTVTLSNSLEFVDRFELFPDVWLDETGDIHVINSLSETYVVGTLTVASDGVLNFTATDPTFFGELRFRYTVSYNDLEDDAEIVLRVTGEPPNAADDTLSTDEDSPLTIDIASLLANDSDPQDGDPTPKTIDATTFAIDAQALHGTVTINDEQVVYTPDANYHGPDSFWYTVADKTGLVSNSAQVTIDVAPVNDAMVGAQGFALYVYEDDSITVNLLDQFNDPDGITSATHSIQITEQYNEYGDLSIHPSGTFTFTPEPNLYTVDHPTHAQWVALFKYRINDNGDLSEEYTAGVTVLPSPDAPVAHDDTGYTASEDTALSLTWDDLLDNDVFLDGELYAGAIPEMELTKEVVTAPAHGRFNGSHYIPDADWSGQDSFTYRVRNAAGLESEATVTIDVTPVNDAPTAADVQINLPYAQANGGALSIDVDVLEYAADVDNAAGDLTVALGTLPSGIQAEIDDNKVRITQVDWSGPGDPSVPFIVSDGAGGSVTRQLTIHILPDALPQTSATIAGGETHEFVFEEITVANAPGAASIDVAIVDGKHLTIEGDGDNVQVWFGTRHNVPGERGTVTWAGGAESLALTVHNGDVNDIDVAGELVLWVGGSVGSITVDQVDHVTVLGDVGTVDADVITSLSIGGSLTGSLTASDIAGVVSVDGDLLGDIDVVTDVHELSIGGGSFGAVTVGGNLRSMDVGEMIQGAIDVGSIGDTTNGITAASDITATLAINGNVGLISSTSGDITSAIDIGTNDIYRIHAGGALRSTIVAGDIEELSAGTFDDVSVTTGGNLRFATASDDITGTFVIGGSLGMTTGPAQGQGMIAGGQLAADVTVESYISHLSAGLDLTGQISADGAIHSIDIGRDLAGSVTTEDRIVSVHVERDLSGSVISNSTSTVDVEGLYAIYEVKAGEVSGTVQAAGDLALVYVDRTLSGTVTSTAAGITDVLAARSWYRTPNDGIVGATISAHGSIDRVESGADDEIVSNLFSLTGWYMLSSIGAGTVITSTTGDVDISVSGSINDTTVVAGGVATVAASPYTTHIDGHRAVYQGRGNIDALTVEGHTVDLDARGGSITNTTVSGLGGGVDVFALHSLQATVTNDGEGAIISSIHAADGDITGSFTTTDGATIGTIQAGGDVDAVIDSAGSIDSIIAGGSIRNAINAAGSVTEILAGFIAKRPASEALKVSEAVDMTRVEKALEAAADPVGALELYKPRKARLAVSADPNANIEADIYVSGNLDYLGAAGSITGSAEVTVTSQLLEVHARGDIEATFVRSAGPLKISAWGAIDSDIQTTAGAAGAGDITVLAYGDIGGKITAQNGDVTAESWSRIVGQIQARHDITVWSFGNNEAQEIHSTASGQLTTQISVTTWGELDATILSDADYASSDDPANDAANVDLTVHGEITGGRVDGAFVKVFSAGVIGAVTLAPRDRLDVFARGRDDAGTLVSIDGALLAEDDVSRSITITAWGDIVLGNAFKARSFFIQTQGDLTGGELIGTGGSSNVIAHAKNVAGTVISANDISIDVVRDITSDVRVEAAYKVEIVAGRDVDGEVNTSQADRPLSGTGGQGTIEAGNISIFAHGNVTGDITAARGLRIVSGGAVLSLISFVPDEDVEHISSIQAYGGFAGDLDSNGDIRLRSWGDINGGSVVGRNVDLFTGGTFSGAILALGIAAVEAWGGLDGVTISLGSIVARTHGEITGRLDAAYDIAATAHGDIAASADIQAGERMAIDTGGVMRADLIAGQRVEVDARAFAAGASVMSANDQVDVAVLEAISGAQFVGPAGVTILAGGDVDAYVETHQADAVTSITSRTGVSDLDFKTPQGQVDVVAMGAVAMAQQASEVPEAMAPKSISVTAFGAVAASSLLAHESLDLTALSNDSGPATIAVLDARTLGAEADINLFAMDAIVGQYAATGDLSATSLQDITGSYTAEGGDALLIAGGSVTDDTDVSAGGDAIVVAAGSGEAGAIHASIDADNDAILLANGDITGLANAGVNASVTSLKGKVDSAVTAATGNADVFAKTHVLKNVTAGVDVSVIATDAVDGHVTADGSAYITVLGSDGGGTGALSGMVTAELDVSVFAVNVASGAQITAVTGDASVAVEATLSGPVTAGGSATVSAIGPITGDITAGEGDGDGDVTVSTIGDLVGAVSAGGGDADVLVGGNLLGPVTADRRIEAMVQGDQSGVLTAGLGADVLIRSDANAAMTFGTAEGADDEITDISVLGLLAGNVTTERGHLTLTVAGELTGTLDVAGDASITALAQVTNEMTIGGFGSLFALGAVSQSQIIAGSFGLTGANAVTDISVTAVDDVVVSAVAGLTGLVIDAGRDAGAIGLADAAAQVDITAGRDAAVTALAGLVDSSIAATTGDVVVLSFADVGGSGAPALTATAGDLIDLTILGGLTKGLLTAGNDIRLVVTGALHDSDVIATVGSVDAVVGQSISLTPFVAGSDINLVAMGDVTADSALDADGDISLVVDGSLQVDVTAGGNANVVVSGDIMPTIMLHADRDATVAALGDINANRIEAGRDVRAFSHGSMSATLDADRDVRVAYARGDLWSTIHSGRHIRLVEVHGDVNTAWLDAATDIKQVKVRGNIVASTLEAGDDVLSVDVDGSIDDLTALTADDLIKHVRGRDAIAADLTAGDVVAGTGKVKLVEAWGDITGSIDAGEAITELRSGAAVNATTSVAPSRVVEDDDYLYDTLSASGAFTWRLPQDSTEWSLPRVGALVGQARRDFSEALRSAFAGRAEWLAERDSQSAALAFNADQAMARLVEAVSRLTKALTHVSQRINDDIAAERAGVEHLANGHESTLMQESRRLTAALEWSRVETVWRFDALGVVLVITAHRYETQAALDAYTADLVAIGTEAGHDWANARRAEVTFEEAGEWELIARRAFHVQVGGWSLAVLWDSAPLIGSGTAQWCHDYPDDPYVRTVCGLGQGALNLIQYVQDDLVFFANVGVPALNGIIYGLNATDILPHVFGLEPLGQVSYLTSVNWTRNRLMYQTDGEYALNQALFAIATLGLSWGRNVFAAAGTIGRLVRLLDTASDPFQLIGKLSTLAQSRRVLTGLMDEIEGGSKFLDDVGEVAGLSHSQRNLARQHAIEEAIENGDLTVKQARRRKHDIHHIASDKDKEFTRQFKQVFDQAGLDLQSVWNRTRISGHVGPHGKFYNEYILIRLQGAVKGKTGTAAREALIGELIELRRELLNGDLADLLRAAASKADVDGAF